MLPQLNPYDDHNQRLEAETHPNDWINPTPSGRYNMVVVGGGTAGLVTAAISAGLGAKTALIEKGLLGGDCLNVGCIPSKAIISAARYAAALRDSEKYGIQVAGDAEVDFGKVMNRMRFLRAGISPHDSAWRFAKLGVDVFFGHGKFVDSRLIDVDGAKLSFKKACIATGARATASVIPGLSEVGYLTNETLFSLTALPKRLAVIGGGPIGTEMAQAFARFGAKVYQIEKRGQILSREDDDAAKIVQDSLIRDGVEIFTETEVLHCEKNGDAKSVFVQNKDGQSHQIDVDEVLLSIGRTPNVEGLDLEKAGIDFDLQHGVRVNDRLQTSSSNIFAAGDVASRHKFTHAADFMGRAVVQNALFPGTKKRVSSMQIPWTTYTSPELSQMGLTKKQAVEKGIEIETFEVSMSDVDRAILDGETDGFVRVHTRKGSDKIIGATIVAVNAGDLIGEVSLAMTHNIGLKKIGSAIHPYPTHAEAIRKLGDLYNRTRFTGFKKRLLKKWFRWTR